MDHSTGHLAQALRDMFHEYPMGDEATVTISVTEPDGRTIYMVQADPQQAAWLSALIAAGHADADRSHSDHPNHGVCAHCERGPVTREVEPELAQIEETAWGEDEEMMPEPSRTLEEMLRMLARYQREMRPNPGPPNWPTVKVSSQSFLNTFDIVGRTRRVQGVDVPKPRPLSAPIIDPAGTRWAGQHWSRPANAQDRLVGMEEDGLDCRAYVELFSDDPYGDGVCGLEFDSAVTYTETENPCPLGMLYTKHAWCPNGHSNIWSTDGG